RSSRACRATLLRLHSLPTRRSSDLLWSFFGLYVLYLTRAFPLSAYALALVVGAPLMVGQVWTLLGTGLLEAGWSHLGFVSMVAGDRKSTRLNSSHVKISYAGFCLKK